MYIFSKKYIYALQTGNIFIYCLKWVVNIGTVYLFAKGAQLKKLVETESVLGFKFFLTRLFVFNVVIAMLTVVS